MMISKGFVFSILCLAFLSQGISLYGQNTLELQMNQIAKSTKGNLGVFAKIIETGEGVEFNGNKKFPMQSVYKFPIAMAVFDKVDKGKFNLEDRIYIKKSEIVPRGVSPIREKFPNGTVMTLRDLLRYNIVESDGTACDVLLRILGGAKIAERYIHKIGVMDIAIATTEMVQTASDTIQYKNWSTPNAMTELLILFYSSKILTDNSRNLLLQDMIESIRCPKRIKGLLPNGTIVAHKPGTSGTHYGLTRATNDVGIISLPNGKHVAISVFISDSYTNETERELTIAKISKAAFDFWSLRK